MTQHGRQDMAIPPPDWYNAKKEGGGYHSEN
jgi:hypothetical protein